MKHNKFESIERRIVDVRAIVIALGIVLLLVTGCNAGETQETPAEVAAVSTEQVVASEEDAEEAFATLPPPVIVQSTNTAVPPTNTPEPTATPESTNTPEATEIPPTNTPAPIPPTNPPPPPPPPTNTPEPPPPPPPPPQKGANGLVASHFALQDRSDYSTGGKIWVEFVVSNSTGSEVPYNVLGIMPKKDGANRLDWFQHSYGGQNSTMKKGGLSWEDNIKMPESGNYTLHLAICFDGIDNCLQGGGTFHPLSDEIPVQIR